jgi:hypothetical protein
MAENVMDQIVAELRRSALEMFSGHPELKNVRVVGHTPKSDHYTYDIVVDFADGSERVSAKVYRASKCGAAGAKQMARTEAGNLGYVYKIFDKKGLAGVPRPLGDFTDLGAVVTVKFSGLPLQSIVMKAALLPGYADHDVLKLAARKAGEWLRSFHKATADMPVTFESEKLLDELGKACDRCRVEGLEEASIRTILSGAKSALARVKKALPHSAVLNDFTPLNIIVNENGVGFCDYAKMSKRGLSFQDAAQFLACVEALEKYPFCNREITGTVQEEFLNAYGVSASEEAVLRVLKMKALLGMFAQGRGIKESAVRKKVMWATVMKRFIQQAAQRSLAPAA